MKGFVRTATLVLTCAIAPSVLAADPAPVRLEQMTWIEVRERIDRGATTALLPIGGTEQNGPHMTLGKHNARVAELADAIARALGDALVAPVLPYVPEGSVSPPVGHMRFAGTLSVPEDAFEGLLAGAAQSLCQHGPRDVVLLGDHGGYQPSLVRVAQRLNARWRLTRPCRAHALTQYYDAQQAGFSRSLVARGYAEAHVGTHAGLADTALTLATAPDAVRPGRYPDAAAGEAVGVHGDPRGATAELGAAGVDLIVTRTVAAIREAVARR